MNFEDLPPAKAISADDQSDGIVVSFNCDLEDAINSEKISAIIRKRVPRNKKFNWLYFHLKSPLCAIVCRAEIKEILNLTKEEVLQISDQIQLSHQEILDYLAGEPSIGCYKVGKFERPLNPLAAAELNRMMIYHAPQSFFILSKRAKEMIDSTARFGC
jgi:predicted transcriptional regulator